MTPAQPTEITELLAAMRAGDTQAGDQLFPLVYGQLRQVAGRLLASERDAATLNPTSLVHEVWLRLGFGSPQRGASLPAADREHFLAITIRAMRQVLIDRARHRRADRRGGNVVRITLDEARASNDASPDELLHLFDALERLGEIEPRLRKVVEYKFLAGLTETETAELLGTTTRTVQRDWVKARAWLYGQLYAGDATS